MGVADALSRRFPGLGKKLGSGAEKSSHVADNALVRLAHKAGHEAPHLAKKGAKVTRKAGDDRSQQDIQQRVQDRIQQNRENQAHLQQQIQDLEQQEQQQGQPLNPSQQARLDQLQQDLQQLQQDQQALQEIAEELGKQQQDKGGVLQSLAKGINWIIGVEQAVTSKLAGWIPFPAMPAIRIGDPELGWPHVHGHPPNVVPPAPPVPLTGPGILIPLPHLSGAVKTYINHMPAARCGDFGVCAWCGGYFPLFEVFLGSATVWIEMARAGRLLVDITKHCIFTTPKPTDPPMGPMIGATLFGSFNVFIGGVPLPSLFSLAIGPAFKALFKTLGFVGKILFKAGKKIFPRAAALGGKALGAMRRLVQAAKQKIANKMAQRAAAKLAKARAAAFVDDLLKSGRFAAHGDDAFQRAVRKDLQRLAMTPSGRKLLDDLAASGQKIDIHSPGAFGKPFKGGPYCKPKGSGYKLDVVDQADGPFTRVPWKKDASGNWVPDYANKRAAHVRGTGAGSGSDVVYDPTKSTSKHFQSGKTPSDVILGHELNHARNNAYGRGANDMIVDDDKWVKGWKNMEEMDTVGFENAYRAERGGVPQRPDYSVLPGLK